MSSERAERAEGSPHGVAERAADLLIFIGDLFRRLRSKISGYADRATGFRSPYGFVRRYFKARPGKYTELRRYLNQARIGVPYDVYLTRAFYYSVMTAVLGAGLGVFVTFVLWSSGTLDSLRSPVSFTGAAAEFTSTYSTPIQGTLITISVGLLFGISSWLLFYYQPRLTADQRRQSINVMLPHGIVFMHALTYGGMSIIDAMRELANSDDVYDEVANEFDVVVRDMDEFGSPLPTALQNARNLTPSDGMRRFFDDLLSTIDSGGDIARFLRTEGERYYEKSKEDQEAFIKNLGVLGELYATIFIAAPLLFIIILLVMSFIGASTLSTIAVVTYVGIPIGVVWFGMLLHMLSKPYSWEAANEIHTEYQFPTPEADEEVINDGRYRSYRRAKTLRSMRTFFGDPFAPLKRSPVLSLLFSVPASLLAFVLLSGTVASPNEMLTAPVRTTTFLVVVPVLVAVVPLSFFHEIKKARIRRIVSRYPVKLSAVANANEMGMSLTDSFDHVSQRGASEIDEEFGRVSDDISWKHDASQALVDCANRLHVPQVSRSMNLIAKASQTTGKLNRILEVASQDTANEYRMKKQRAQEMSGYIAVIIVSFLVYLSVILMLDRFYLVPLYEAIPAPEPGTTRAGAAATDVGSLTRIPIETYRTLFFHSALILAFGNGILAGKMGENDAMAGLKYGVAFALLTVVAFWVIT